MKLSTLHVWRQVHVGQTGLLSGAHLSKSNGAAEQDSLLRWVGRTVLLGSACWLVHDIAHRRWTSVAGDAVAILSAATLAIQPVGALLPGAPGLRKASSLAALAGSILSAAFPEID